MGLANRVPLSVTLSACLLVLLGACSPSSSSSSSGAAGTEDAGTSACDGGTCATTATTALVVTAGAAQVTLNRAQLGLESADAGGLLYVEAHAGGAPECPSASSPTPDQTFILANVPPGSVGTSYTLADGVRGTLLDFAGTLWSDIRPARAVDLHVTIVERVSSPPASAYVVLDVTATFDGGSLAGRLSATHCDSLDGP